MTRALLALTGLALTGLALAASAQAQRRAPSVQTEGGAFAYFGTTCDCDETDYVFRTRSPLAGHTQPSETSPVVRMIDAGRLIEGNDWDVVVTVVPRPATGTLRTPIRLEGARRMRDPRRGNWDTSTEARTATVPAGTAVEVYSNYGGEGYVTYGGTTYFGTVAMGDEVAWGPRGEDATGDETWYRLLPRRGVPAAWVRIGSRGEDANVDMLCETHGGCVAGFTPTYQPNRP